MNKPKKETVKKILIGTGIGCAVSGGLIEIYMRRFKQSPPFFDTFYNAFNEDY
jgi:hypothetical protein